MAAEAAAAAAAPAAPPAGPAAVPAMDDSHARCGDHPYGPNPGGICALCLQEKLGKLVSSSNFAATFFPVPLSSGAASSSFSPSLPSPTTAKQMQGAAAGGGDSSSVSSSPAPANNKKQAQASKEGSGGGGAGGRQRPHGNSRFPFLVYAAHGHIRKRSKKGGTGNAGSGGRAKTGGVCSSTAAASNAAAPAPAPAAVPSTDGTSTGAFVLKRSKSVAPRPAEECAAAVIGRSNGAADLVDSPRKRWFWSFLYLSFHTNNNHHSSSPAAQCNTTADLAAQSLMTRNKHQQQHHMHYSKPHGPNSTTTTKLPTTTTTSKQPPAAATADHDAAADPSPPAQKVSRSRSVGCGSRSFSSDFLERISTGLVGDCTLRRVESHREHAPACKQPNTTTADVNATTSDANNANDKVVVLRRLSSSGAVDPDRRHNNNQHRVRWCGGIFGGLGMVSSSFSSSFWFPEELCGGGAAARAQVDADGTVAPAGAASTGAALGTPRGGRGKTWGWSFAGPIRAFRPSSNSSSKSSSCPEVRNTCAAPIDQTAAKRQL